MIPPDTDDPPNVDVTPATILNRAFAPFTAIAGTVFNGVVSTFKDANNLSQPGDFISTIDWGDGSPVITGTIGGANGDFTVSGAHTYAAPGTYTVRTVLEHPTGPPAVAVGTGPGDDVHPGGSRHLGRSTHVTTPLPQDERKGTRI